MNDIQQLVVGAAIGLAMWLFGYLVGKTSMAQKVTNWRLFERMDDD